MKQHTSRYVQNYGKSVQEHVDHLWITNDWQKYPQPAIVIHRSFTCHPHATIEAMSCGKPELSTVCTGLTVVTILLLVILKEERGRGDSSSKAPRAEAARFTFAPLPR